ncbi:MAG: heptosyltransferase [Sphingobacteriales bacterium UTBCD1]|jgi:heptosyltransferase-2|nr:MAG: heptosyltransferase [Sphingobacteriales bacterium UTBCD1]
MKKFLIIQTAFIGDVVLTTGLIEKLHQHFPGAAIDFLVRKGNEGLLTGHPLLREVLVWNKNRNKYSNLWKLLRQIRKRKYNKVINAQRFAATGFLTVFSGAESTVGFDKNPFSFLFSEKVKHQLKMKGINKHEIIRNHELIQDFTDTVPAKPVLYPSAEDEKFIQKFKGSPYITVCPASVWFTKRYPKEKWIDFLNRIPAHYSVYILGAPGDKELAEEIKNTTTHKLVTDLCGQLSFLQSAALMKDAAMNYANDSAPLHFASAMNAPVTAIYCSTVPSFGFTPLSDKSFIVETDQKLTCRPCGLHGRKACPLGHFNCAHTIRTEQLLNTLP